MAEVKLEKVYKRYGQIETVHGIDLEIPDSSFTVLVGPSGCGKSTTLRMVAGLEKISRGTIKINGKVVNDIPPSERDVAMVFQNYALYPHMNVYENMSFSLRMKKRPKVEIEQAVQKAADILGLKEYLQRKPAALSGGQRQRVAMGRAIVRNAKVFLFDEPLSNLDAQLRTQMRLELKRLHYRLKTTTLYVTHDQTEAMTLADQIVVLKDGYIEQVGSPVEVYKQPNNLFVAKFIGNPNMNVFPAKVLRENGEFVLQTKDLKLPIPSKDSMKLEEGMEVLGGIQPDDITIATSDDGIPENCKMDGIVNISETMGRESLLDITVGGNDLISEIEGRYLPQTGTQLKFGFNLEYLHIFEPKSEATLY